MKIYCRILVVMLAVLISVLPCSAEALSQNTPSGWAVEFIAEAESIGLLENSTDLVYCENITREQFCELVFDLIMITKKSISTPEYQNPFTDTKNRKVLVLYAAGIICGKSETEFAPNDLLTRQEAATILVRMIDTVMPMFSTMMYFDYADKDEISDFASNAIQTISNLGFMVGIGDNRFAPLGHFTVEQTITTLVRIYNAVKADYAYETPLGTVTSNWDCAEHVNFAIASDVRILLIKEKSESTLMLLAGPYRGFTNQTSSMYITFDDFAAIFGGTWALDGNVFSFTYDTSASPVPTEYTANETVDGQDWPNKTDAVPVIFFSEMPTILINGVETDIRAQYGGRVYPSSIMMYNGELYIPVQMAADLIDYEIAATEVLWN